jgi:hypothetical protein
MQLVGTIVSLQVQRSSLKIGNPPQRRYDPTPLFPVDSLELNVGGVVGWTADRTSIDDVHHRDHPSTKQVAGKNGISFGFTSHYESMRVRFGGHLTDGIAGENILIETDQMVGEDDLAPGVVIVTADRKQIPLERVIAAAPCVEFSRFALRFPDDRRPDETVTEALRFLNDGMRGYYAAYEGQPIRVAVGDQLYVLTW